MNQVSRFALCLSSFVALAAVACSGAPDPTPTSSSKKPSTAGGTTTTPGGSKAPSSSNSTGSDTTTPGASTPLSDTSACGKKADAMTCDDCCVATSPKGALDAADQAEGDCVCAAAACQTACSASVCSATDNMNQPTDACFTCLDAHQAECAAKFDAACTTAECKAVVSCMKTQCDPLDKMTAGSSSGGSSGAFGASTARETSSASAVSKIGARVTAARSADQQ